MRLKKIEIQGFKSFADKTAIEIKEGTTAIVGPNGSGKSNISDAIRWVLGEQSVKNLRGNRMEDVIFAGTSKRRALGYAEVTITLDNQDGEIALDYSEVEVTRRMFRSGESEYYLNRNSCRLRDIRELFMDTGVGKDGYSIIGQGRIDEILSNRPEDRRGIFEEAAGIVKYKSKKEEAERKLGKTEANILRIKDLIYEISNQLENLEEQANKASIFNKLFNRLKDLEVNLFIKEIKKIKVSNEEIVMKKSSLEKELFEINANKEEIEGEFNRLKLDINELESRIEKSRDSNIAYQKQLERLENQLAISQEKHKFLVKDLDRLHEERLKLEEKVGDLSVVDEELKKKILIGKQQRQIREGEYRSKLDDLEELDRKIKESEKEIELGKDHTIKLYNLSSERKSELNSISSFNENIDARISQLQGEIDGLKAELESKKIRGQELLKEEDKIIREISELQILYENNKSFISINTKSLEDLDNRINNIKGDLQSKISSLKILENMERDYEGYFKGVKSTLNIAKSNPRFMDGFVGIVADLIKVEPKYEKAIEISLGSNIQNIVTINEQDAKNIIGYLRDNRLGRVTCLPLNIIKGSKLSLNPKDMEKFKVSGLGHELISYDKKYDNIFKYLLGRTIIIKDLDYGIGLANKYGYIHKIVTLQGELINPGGSMTGGSYGDSGISIISRRARIERVSQEINKLRVVLEDLEKEKMRLLEELRSSQTEIEGQEESIKNKEFLLFDIRNQYKNGKLEKDRIWSSIGDKENEIKTLNSEKEAFDIRYEELIGIITQYENEIEEEKKKADKLSSIYKSKKLERDERQGAITSNQIELNTLDSEVKNLEEKLSNNALEIENSLNDLETKAVSIGNIENNIKEIADTKRILNNEIVQVEENVGQSKNELNNYIGAKNEVMEKFYLSQDRLMDYNKVSSDLDKSINNQDLKLAKNLVQLENYHKKLSEDYELEYEKALELETGLNNSQEAIVEIRK
ncbi:MAG: chromosome segregation protein SMC, partial [Tissierellaceae bacterium]